MKRYLSSIVIAVLVLAVVWAVIPSAQASPMGGKAATATPTRTSTPSGPTPTPAPVLSGIYYVDCAAASNGNGSQASPWNNLTSVNAQVFGPGASILFKRGTTCAGQLWPKGSGDSTAAITLDAYGSGALPIINGGTNQATIKLYDQQYWHIQNLDVTGGTDYGIFINGTRFAQLNHFRLTNLVVHNVTGGTLTNKLTGLVVIGAADQGPATNDVII